MIEILTEHTRMRVEAARVIITGFEQFEFFATPWFNPETGEPNDGKWVVTVGSTGRRIAGDNLLGTSPDEAAEIARCYMLHRKITPARLAKLIEEQKLS